VARRWIFLILFIAAALAVAALWRRQPPASPLPIAADVERLPAAPDVLSPPLASKLSALLTREEKADATFWAPEIEAQRLNGLIEAWWDQINAATNKLEIVASLPFGSISLPSWSPPLPALNLVELQSPIHPNRTLSQADWTQHILGFARSGWQLHQVECRQISFQPQTAQSPPHSVFSFTAQCAHRDPQRTTLISGSIQVEWFPNSSTPSPSTSLARPPAPPRIRSLDASQLAIRSRIGPTGFNLAFVQTIDPAPNPSFIDPLLVMDLNRDGLSEIVLAAKNLVYTRNSQGTYRPQTLCTHPIPHLATALLADFDGNATLDLLCANASGLHLFSGSNQLTFATPSSPVWSPAPNPTSLEGPVVLTCGDLDADGDLDVFLGQYRVPSLGQILRPEFHNANDGFPSFLLQNDGHGRFTTITNAPQFNAKSRRRVFSASLVDLNLDQRPELLTISDFAGLDLFENPWPEPLRDVSTTWMPETHAFGMGHALNDFNSDGLLDVLMIGMISPTVSRLHHLNLWRSHPGKSEDRSLRTRMTFGNRLYLRDPNSTNSFTTNQLSTSIAASGWSWGVASADFDNNGFPDAYIANGNESRSSVRDYESEFWLHDLYIDSTVDDATATAYLTSKFARTRGNGWSYGGHEKNRLFMNDQAQSFTDLAPILGVSLGEDCRNVVADDIDGDGQVDLIVTTFEIWPEKKQTLRVYRNQLPSTHSWIGFKFVSTPQSLSPVGTHITIESGGRLQSRQLVTGDSYRSQHPATLHFGTGTHTLVTQAEVTWPNGEKQRIANPTPRRYHILTPPSRP